MSSAVRSVGDRLGMDTDGGRTVLVSYLAVVHFDVSLGLLDNRVWSFFRVGNDDGLVIYSGHDSHDQQADQAEGRSSASS